MQDGEVIDGETARTLLKVSARPFAQAIIGLASSVGFNKRKPDPIPVPETILDFDPTPGAFTSPSGQGKVTINFGMYLSIRAMPFTISWLQRQYESTNSVAIGDTHDIAIPSRVLDELEGVLRWWHRFRLLGKVNIGGILGPSMTSAEAEAADLTIHQIFYFITFHEFAHWFALITPPEERKRVESKTRDYLSAWPLEDVLTDPSIKRQLGIHFQRNPRVFDSWVEEMRADSVAAQFCLNYFPEYFEQPDFNQVVRQVFAAQALTYFLLGQLSEVFFESILGQPLSWRTHPPSGLRANIFCHIGGKVRGESQAEFATRDWGVGTFVELVVDRIIEALKVRIGAHGNL